MTATPAPRAPRTPRKTATRKPLAPPAAQVPVQYPEFPQTPIYAQLLRETIDSLTSKGEIDRAARTTTTGRLA